MNFQGSYLRILTPRTTNGVIPLTINGEVQYKESFAPLTAKKQFEKKAARLTKNGHTQLVPIIEVVGEEPVKPNPKPAASSTETEVKAPKKPNPKPKKVKPE